MPDRMTIDDFDDLFKRAAEQYPLRIDNSGWEKVAHELEQYDKSYPQSPDYSRQRITYQRKAVGVLLLLAFVWTGYYVWNSAGGAKSKIDTEKKARNLRDQTAGKDQTTSLVARGEAIKAEEQRKGSALSNANGLSAEQNAKKKEFEDEPARTGKDKYPSSGVSSSGVELSGKSKPTTHPASAAHQEEPRGVFSGDVQASQPAAGLAASKKYPANPGNPIVRSQGIHAEIAEVYDKTLFHPDIGNNNSPKPLVGAAVKSNTVLASKENRRISSLDNGRSQPRFYAGVLIAPDISMVKFQSIKGVGYTAGALVGYNVSRKVAVETGLYYDYKKYYSDGKYFNSKNVPFLSDVDLLNVDGSCKMIEVPLNLRYNVKSKGRSRWFATGGLSTYFMFKEGYTYQYLDYGYVWEKYYAYHMASQNWLSVLNLSAGYEYSLGRKATLRIEPYLRIPLSGIGTGSLPIMSAGLNIGITMPIK
jgi:hypothetical protein